VEVAADLQLRPPDVTSLVVLRIGLIRPTRPNIWSTIPQPSRAYGCTRVPDFSKNERGLGIHKWGLWNTRQELHHDCTQKSSFDFLSVVYARHRCLSLAGATWCSVHTQWFHVTAGSGWNPNRSMV